MKKLLVIILVIFSFSAIGEIRVRPVTWAQPILDSGLDNFYKVDEGVYRSKQPVRKNSDDLKAASISEVLNLRELHSDDSELSEKEFTLYHVPMEAGSVTHEQLIAALAKIKNRNSPILIHCWHGSDRTGATIAAYRIIFNNWPKSAAIDEMKNGGFGYHSSVYPNLIKLIEDIDVARYKRELGLDLESKSSN